MTRHRRSLALAAVLALTGCSETSEEPRDTSASGPAAAASTAPPSQEALAPLVLADGTTVGIDGDPPEAVGDVGYGGTITTLEGGCWGFDDGLDTTVFFLIEGTELADDGVGVVTTDGVELHVGDRIHGGGYGVRPGSQVDQQWRADRPECFEGRSPGVYISVDRVDTEAG